MVRPEIFKLVVFALFFAASVSQAQDPGSWDARVVSVVGSVKVAPAGGGPTKPVQAGFPLMEGDRLITASGSSCDVALEGGRLLQLDAQSDLRLTSLRREAAELTLMLGGFLARIKTLAAAHRLRVRTPTAVCAVRGTEFGMRIENTKRTYAAVFDKGLLEVSGLSGLPVRLGPNHETSVSAGAQPSAPGRLLRFAGRRKEMAAVAGRAADLERAWEALSPEARAERRDEALGDEAEAPARMIPLGVDH